MPNAITSLNGLRGEQIASSYLLRYGLIPLPFPPNYPKFDILALDPSHEICSFIQVKYNSLPKPIWKTSNSVESSSGKKLTYLLIHDDPLKTDSYIIYIIPEADLINISSTQNAEYVVRRIKDNPGYIDNNMRSIDLSDPKYLPYVGAVRCLCPFPAERFANAVRGDA